MAVNLRQCCGDADMHGTADIAVYLQRIYRVSIAVPAPSLFKILRKIARASSWNKTHSYLSMMSLTCHAALHQW